MASATAAPGLVPITRDYLRQFFEEHPAKPIHEDVEKLTDRMTQLIDDLEKQREGKEPLEETLPPAEMPKKIDQSLWLHREQTEEVMDLVKEERRPAAGVEALDACCNDVAERVGKTFEMVRRIPCFCSSVCLGACPCNLLGAQRLLLCCCRSRASRNGILRESPTL